MNMENAVAILLKNFPVANELRMLLLKQIEVWQHRVHVLWNIL